MKFLQKLLFSALVALAVAACGKKNEVAFDTLEDARAQARANAVFNATQYRSENPRLQGMSIVGHGDSTQTPACPQGDGWASLSVMSVDPDKKTIQKVKIKCSTVSGQLGCYTEDDFQTKPFAKDENQCQPTNKVPFPIPKIAK